MSNLSYVLRTIWQEPSNRGQRLSRVAGFAGWQAWKRLVGRPRTVCLGNGLRMRAYPDCGVAPAAIYYALPNSEHIAFLRQHLNGGTLLDVGANIGLMTLLLARQVQHAILFEPNPTAAARARENLALNHLPFEVESKAISDSSGTIRMEDSGGGSPVNRLVSGFETTKPTIEVERLTLDAYLADYLARRGPLPAPLSAIKIDVEGHENSVIAGMAQTLRELRPLVMFEYLQRTNIVETLRLFAEAEYAVFGLTANGLRQATAQVAPLQDLFAWPRERAQELPLSTTA